MLYIYLGTASLVAGMWGDHIFCVIFINEGPQKRSFVFIYESDCFALSAVVFNLLEYDSYHKAFVLIQT